MSVNFKIFEELIEELEKLKLFYEVFGGFALDGKRGRLTRKHDDVDVFCRGKDYSKLKKALLKLNYNLLYEINDLKAFQKPGLKIDLCLLKRIGSYCECELRYVKLLIPLTLLHNIQRASIGNCTFNIVPDELLKKDALNSRYREDREYGKKIKVNKELFNRIICEKLQPAQNL